MGPKALSADNISERKHKQDEVDGSDEHDSKRIDLSATNASIAPLLNRATFLGIPPELRNAIYSMVFTFGECDAYNPVLAYRGLHSCSCRGQSLMQVSKRIRHETLALFYENHEFRLLLSDGHTLALQTWLNSLAPDVFNHIKRFQFRWSERSEHLYYPLQVHVTFMVGEADMHVSISAISDRLTDGSWKREEIRTQRVIQLEDALEKVRTSVDKVDGSPVLTKAKLLELMGAAGWEPLL